MEWNSAELKWMRDTYRNNPSSKVVLYFIVYFLYSIGTWKFKKKPPLRSWSVWCFPKREPRHLFFDGALFHETQ